MSAPIRPQYTSSVDMITDLLSRGQLVPNEMDPLERGNLCCGCLMRLDGIPMLELVEKEDPAHPAVLKASYRIHKTCYERLTRVM